MSNFMLRKQSSDKDPADWFYAASDRLKIADLAWANEGLTQSGIELLQEAVERYLKGYLVAKGSVLKRTHDLGRFGDRGDCLQSTSEMINLIRQELPQYFSAAKS